MNGFRARIFEQCRLTLPFEIVELACVDRAEKHDRGAYDDQCGEWNQQQENFHQRALSELSA